MKAWLGSLWSRLKATTRPAQLDEEFDEELACHLELLIEDGRRRGLSENEARRQARLALGQPLALREGHRDERGFPWLDALAEDAKYAARSLRKSPVFTTVVTLSLALGIGTNTALFSLVNALLLRTLPVPEPDRLVLVELVASGLGIKKAFGSFPGPVFDEVRANAKVVSSVVGFAPINRPTLIIDGAVEPERRIEEVSENFFQDLGAVPILGRAPGPADGAVAILSDNFWRTRFDRNPSTLGSALNIAGHLYTVIGVAPPRFLGLSVETATDIWVSSTADKPMRMIARLSAGVDSLQAQAALQPLFSGIATARPDLLPRGPTLQVNLAPAGKGLSQLRAQYSQPLIALLVLVVLVLLITCANVSNLLMVRHAARRREMALRVALGASRGRLISRALVECMAIAGLGGLLALAFARAGVAWALSILPLPVIPEGLAFRSDARVLGFVALASILSALLFGLAPAWTATSVDPGEGLKINPGGSGPRSARRLGRWLVAGQVALSVLLLVGAGLFVRTLTNLTKLDVGFNADRLLQVSLDTRAAGYGDGQVGGVYRLLLERVAAIPGVRSVTVSRNGVMQNGSTRMSITSPDIHAAADEGWDAIEVGPAFFETMGLRILRGRGFTVDDFGREDRPLVVNEAFVKRCFPDGVALGKVGGRVVGVVPDARIVGMRNEVGPMVFEMARKEPDRISAMVVRMEGDSTLSVSTAIAREIRRVNPRLFLNVRTMKEQIDQNLARERMVASTSSFFSLLGVLLAAIGIFGVASSTVAQRTTELGIRMALGAGRPAVIRESLRETAVVFGAGLAIGIVAASMAVRLAASLVGELLFGLSATDEGNIAVSVVLMAVVALLASLLPARRATRIDPLAAIRHE